MGVSVLVLTSHCLTRTLWQKPRAAKTRQRAEIFAMIHVSITQNLTKMYCLSTYVPEKCLLMPLFFPYVPPISSRIQLTGIIC